MEKFIEKIIVDNGVALSAELARIRAKSHLISPYD